MRVNVICSFVMLFFVMAFWGCADSFNIMHDDEKPLAPIENYRDVLKPEFRMMGKVSAPLKAGWLSEHSGAELDGESIVYVNNKGSRSIKQLLIVRTYQIRGESAMFLPDLDFNNQLLLDSGTVQMASKNIKYNLLFNWSGFGGDELKLIKSKGLLMPNCYLLKTYSSKLMSGIFVKSISHILYVENIGSEDADVACKGFIESQKNGALVKSFSVTADGYVNLLMERIVEQRGLI